MVMYIVDACYAGAQSIDMLASLSNGFQKAPHDSLTMVGLLY